MSGIAGVCGKASDQVIMDRLILTMKRRGPYGDAFMMDGDCCLIESYSMQNKPDTLTQCEWAGEHYSIVFDGVVYNKDELWKEMIRAGHNVNKQVDAEVVLHAYFCWGAESLHRLNGVFAFAIWNSNQKKLFIARDRIGVKPLFYSCFGSTLIFGSEIKTVLAHPDINAQIDSEGIAQLLLLGPGRIPGSGVFKGINELRPGCYGEFIEGKWCDTQYWKLTDKEHTETFEETAYHVRYLLLDAIALQTDRVDQLGTFLSGGLDSSIISSICSDICMRNGKKLMTFSVDYEDHEKYFVSNKFQPETDRRYIDLMRNRIGSDHLDVILSPDDLYSCIDDATVARDLPGMADVDFSLYAFSKRIREHTPLALSGECADEIFGGYPWYRDPEIRAAEGFPWAQNTAFRASFIRSEHLKGINPGQFVMDHYKTTVNRCDVLPGASQLECRMKELVNLNFEWFMQTLLDRNDRMCAAHNLDVRVPFCDYRIAEYLYCVPWDFKDYGNREKGLLRYAMRGLLPDEVLYRKKSPYPKTFDPRYLEIVSNELERVISDSTSPLLQIVRKDALLNLLITEFSWPWYGQLMKLPQTIAYMLQINRWLSLYNISVV